MKKTKYFILIFFASVLLGNCSTLKEGFANNKKKSTDEFLVEKKQPLVMPPNFEKLPLPDVSLDNKQENEEKTSSLEKVLKDSNKTNENSENNTQTNSIESLILKEIKK